MKIHNLISIHINNNTNNDDINDNNAMSVLLLQSV